MAISVPAATISINPKLIENGSGDDPDCSTICSTCPTRRSPSCSAEVDSKERGFVYVARQVDSAVGDQISEPRPARCQRRSRGPAGDARRRHRTQRHRQDQHRRRRHRRTRAAVRRPADRHRRRDVPRGRARRTFDPRLRDRHRGAGRRRRPRAHARSVDPVLHRAGAAREGVARSAPAARRRSSWTPHTGEIWRWRRCGVNDETGLVRGDVRQLRRRRCLRARLGRQGHHRSRAP